MQLAGENEKGFAVNNKTSVIVVAPQVGMGRRLTFAVGGYHCGRGRKLAGIHKHRREYIQFSTYYFTASMFDRFL
jgi:hypothetical protein